MIATLVMMIIIQVITNDDYYGNSDYHASDDIKTRCRQKVT